MTRGVTREWVAQQKAKAECPVVEGWRDGALTVWVPGKPYNFKSGSATTHGAMMKHRKLVAEWRDRTGSRIYAQKIAPWTPAAPKRVTFTVYSRKPFDDDGLRVTCSPSRDALIDMRLIDDDATARGHVFVYDNVVRPKMSELHGIAIRIESAR